ncbi:hypothetical protein MSAN_00276400 [Mycena sanguinolenta]|uniref:Uncharacterized protein n=1 Tax=Mycena sanguinolenta TaxID=230812 RepID=A0A8H7DLH2_9AGAR|nr:hypothetical protein MSAN_00276400 [Mycena sanguinolenta]
MPSSASSVTSAPSTPSPGTAKARTSACHAPTKSRKSPSVDQPWRRGAAVCCVFARVTFDRLHGPSNCNSTSASGMRNATRVLGFGDDTDRERERDRARIREGEHDASHAKELLALSPRRARGIRPWVRPACGASCEL